MTTIQPRQPAWHPVALTRLAVLGLAVVALAGSVAAQPASDAAAKSNFSKQVAALTAAVNQKFATGKTTQADLAENLKAIHDLISSHLKDDDHEDLARLHLLNAHIYADGLNFPSTARGIWNHVVKTFPGTQAARDAQSALAQFDEDSKSPVGLMAAAPGAPEIGKLAPDFTAQDSNGKAVKLSGYRGKIVVLETFYDGCPFCAHHYETGATQELQREEATNGVVWLLIDPIDSPAHANEVWAADNMAISDWIVDTGYQIARNYAARTAPEIYIIDKRGVLAYQGAVDDRPGREGDPRTARNYIREAVSALVTGQSVPVPETKPYGCVLMYSGMPDQQLFRPPGFR